MRLFSLLSLLAACAVVNAPAEQPPAGPAPDATREPGLYAIINTSLGPITAKLLEREAPQTVANFVALANGSQSWKDPNTGAMVTKPLYRNLAFHRVIPDYVIQTGDPTNTGTYDCGVRVKDEIVKSLKFDRPGRLGVMNAGAPDTGGCQFFITDDAYSSLDRSPQRNGYTIFGQVVGGQETVGAISRVPLDAKNRPSPPARLVSVTIQRVGSEPAAPVLKKSAVAAKWPKLD